MASAADWSGEAIVLVPRAALARLFAVVGDAVPLRLLDDAGTIAWGDLSIDLMNRQVMRAGAAILLHPREFDVLACLARHRGAPVSRAALYAAVWHRGFDPGTNVIAVTVSRLRAKIDTRGAPPLVRTVPGGYALGDALAAA